MTARYFQVVALAAFIACGGSSTHIPVPPQNASYLTAMEVASANAATWTAYDAIARLRPNWMASHGMSSFGAGEGAYAIVFIDGQRHGALATLRNIPANQIKDFRYYDVTQAGATFGLQAGTGGVIELRTK